MNQASDSDDEGAASDDSHDHTGESLQVEVYLTVLEQDALGEIGNITFGSSATALSTLLPKFGDNFSQSVI
jgi:flagellar motor switch protein FliN/FliY